CINLAFAQAHPTISLNKQRMTIKSFLAEVKKQTGYSIVHIEDSFDISKQVELNIKDQPLDKALRQVLAPQDINFTIRNNTIVLTKTKHQGLNNSVKVQQSIVVTGTVLDSQGRPIAGATISLNQRNTVLAVSDFNGKFEVELSDQVKTLHIAHISFEPTEITLVPKQNSYKIVLTDKIDQLEEAVVTGIYTRDKESFTGSSSTFTQKELKMVGNSNV